MMKILRQTFFALMISVMLAFSGGLVTQAQIFGQDRKPKELPKESPKEDKKQDKEKEDRNRDEKKGGEKKKPD